MKTQFALRSDAVIRMTPPIYQKGTMSKLAEMWFEEALCYSSKTRTITISGVGWIE